MMDTHTHFTKSRIQALISFILNDIQNCYIGVQNTGIVKGLLELVEAYYEGNSEKVEYTLSETSYFMEEVVEIKKYQSTITPQSMSYYAKINNSDLATLKAFCNAL